MSKVPRRSIYRRSKRLLVKLLVSRWEGSRRSLERHVWRFLRGRRRQYLLRLLQEKAVAASAAALLLITSAVHADPVIPVSDLAAGRGGFEIAATQGMVGFSVSGGADVSGDGLDDVLVGAPTGYYNDSNPGKVYVVFGKANTSVVDVSTIEAGTGGFVINGNSGSKPIGRTVSMAPLINNGSNADIVTSAESNQFGGESPVFVVHGKATTGAVNVSSAAAGSGGFAITGIETMYDAAPVYAFGDINGDGRDDIVVGAPYNNYYTGRVYVAFGRNGTTAATAADLANGVGGFVIDGAAVGNEAGTTVSIVPDMTGDGRDEIVLGARGANSGFGAAYLVFGRGVGGPVDLSSFTNGFTISGGYSGEYAGRVVAGCEDIDGDGRGDIVMGAPFNDSSNDGNVYVIFGKNTNSAVSTVDIANGSGGFVVNGRALSAQAGIAVSSAGDLNGDGLEDVIIGTNRFSIPGEAYVVFGKSSTTPVSLENVWSGVGGFGIAGTVPNDSLGTSVSRAGDVNGDGVDDVVVGAPGINRAYVVFGKDPAPVSVGLTNSATGNPISSGVVYVERTDAPVGFRAPLAGLVGGNAIYNSRFTDIGDFNVTAIASGFKASDPVLVSNDGGSPGIQLDPDLDLVEPNILTVVIRVLNQQGQPTGQRVLTKTAQLFLGDESPVGITPVYGQGEMIFIGAPSGELHIIIPDTAQHDFLPKTVNLGTGVQQTVVVDAMLLDGAAVPRAELPGIVVGSVLNGSSDPSAEYAYPLVIHTLNANGLATSTDGTVDGAYVFADVVAGAGEIQAFSDDGTIAGSFKPVSVTSGQIYGDQPSEDTLLSVSPPSGDSDFDGLPDEFESEYLSGVPSNLRGPDDDPDLDGLTNMDELIAGTHPGTFDSDSDSVADGVELVLGANPNSAMSTPTAQSLVYVDFGHAEPLQAGLLLHPYRALDDALQGVTSGGTIRIKGDVGVTTGTKPDSILSKPLTIEAVNGTIRIE